MASLVSAVRFPDASAVMRHAIQLAQQGEGLVEPNPMVGAVIVDGDLNCLAEGWHERFGGPHAEINSLGRCHGPLSFATLYVTLEPCCHHGKTPPCTKALIEAGLHRVVVATRDPSDKVAGKGIAELRTAGIDVEVGLLEMDAKRLVAPFAKMVATGRPYVHAKWAMTLDGKLATRSGVSQWISNAASRAIVHALRGRMDAILVGAGTVRTDDPLLTARPAGPRVAARIVLDSMAELPVDSQLVMTASEAPVLVIAGPEAPQENLRRLEGAGIEVLSVPAADEPSHRGDTAARRPDLVKVLEELGRRQMTNVLVEGGGELLGTLFDSRLIDEVHVFVAPKIVGGTAAITPVGGLGLELVPQVASLQDVEIQIIEGDTYIRGRVSQNP